MATLIPADSSDVSPPTRGPRLFNVNGQITLQRPPIPTLSRLPPRIVFTRRALSTTTQELSVGFDSRPPPGRQTALAELSGEAESPFPGPELERDILFAHTVPDVFLSAPDTFQLPFARLANLLFVSSPGEEDIPQVHQWARKEMERVFASGPHDLLPAERYAQAEKALALALDFDIRSIQKGLFYTFIMEHHFEDDPPAPTLSSSPPSSPASEAVPTPINEPTPSSSLLHPEDLARCHDLQSALLRHFSPVLFQAPPGLHMACSDALADSWLNLIIPAALGASSVSTDAGAEDDGAERGAAADALNLDLGRPLETLLSIERVDWAARGVCDECVREKREEWRAEREVIWAKMDDWLGLKKENDS